jgi:hypothetical protein
MFNKNKYNRKGDEVSWFIDGEGIKLISLMSLARNEQTSIKAVADFMEMMTKAIYRNHVFYSPVYLNEQQVADALSLAYQFTQEWIANDFMLSLNFTEYSARCMAKNQVLMKEINYPYTLKQKQQFWIDMVEAQLIEFTDVRKAWTKQQDSIVIKGGN